jgi:hypothetical protein
MTGAAAEHAVMPVTNHGMVFLYPARMSLLSDAELEAYRGWVGR